MTDDTSHEARISDLEKQIADVEMQLKRERARFALAERATRVGYWRLTLENMQTTWSDGMYALLGLEPGSPVPQPAALTSVEENAPEIASYYEKRASAIRNGVPFSERTRLRGADGTLRIIDTFGEPEFGPDGDVAAFVGACRDVTQEVRIEDERNKAQRLYRIMTEAASDIITVHKLYSGEGHTEFASAALTRMLGWTLKDLRNDRFFELVHPDDIAEAKKLKEISPSGKPVTATYRVRHADDHYVWIEGSFSTVFDEATGEILYRVGIARDISERKAYEEAMQAARLSAEAANRAKSAFLANMSHELRTPLNAIIGFADLMGHETFGPIENAHYRNYVSLIHQSGQHLLALINDLLDMSKIEAGKFELEIENVNLAAIVDECIQTMSSLAAQRDVTLGTAIPADGLTCSADRRALKQIVLNLLSNGIKFTPAGGRVDVNAAVAGNHIRLEIHDNGIGIAAEDLPRLAQPFEQVRNDPNLAKSGSGLGLALVRALVEQHGGRFAIASPAQKGTVVTVEIPRSAPVPQRHVAASWEI